MEQLRTHPVDAVLLDLTMPGMGGMETCRAIRANSDVPIIVISGKKSRADLTEAFDAGADQYVVKPFGVDELVARICAVDRRVNSTRSKRLVLGDVSVDFETHEVKRKDGDVRLTAKEFKLLHCLASRPGDVISHRRLLQAVWGPDYGDEVEYLRVFINQLRKKIEPDPSNPAYILTDPSMGYRLSVPNPNAAPRETSDSRA